MQEGEQSEPIAIVSAVVKSSFALLRSGRTHETVGSWVSNEIPWWLLASPLPKETIKKRKIRRKKCLNLKILS